MEQPAVTGLAGVVLITDRLAAQRRLFGELLGLPTAWATEDAHVFRVGAASIGFFEPSHHPEAVPRLGGACHGISHLEFTVSPRARSAVERLLTPHSVGDAMFEDADGNLFHLVER
jgi:catechol 2,3-dioxygenase-like lactoylglutathione lyase family enzyme